MLERYVYEATTPRHGMRRFNRLHVAKTWVAASLGWEPQWAEDRAAGWYSAEGLDVFIQRHSLNDTSV